MLSQVPDNPSSSSNSIERDVRTSARSNSPDVLDPPLIYQGARPGVPAYYGYVPMGLEDRATLPLVVGIHGISRDAKEMAELLLPEARSRDYALIAPHFDHAGYHDYQRLGRRGRGARADLALIEAWKKLELAADCEFGPIYLLGYSGGAQFAHRFVMAHPNLVDAATIAAAGWYTDPAPRRRYPTGLRVDGELAGVRLEPLSFLRVPMLITVGSNDTRRDASVRTNASLDERQGRNRVERARRFCQKMGEAAATRGVESRTTLREIPNAGHSVSECVENGLSRMAFDFFASAVRGL